MSALTSTLTDDERAKLAAIGDLLITRSSGMPSASDADAHHEYIDRVFSVRPDLVDVVRAGLAELDEPLPESFEDLETDRLPSFRPLAEAITAAYFLNPDVARLVGYQKRSVIPIRFDEDLDGLVAPVSARGAIYRHTPTPEEQH